MLDLLRDVNAYDTFNLAQQEEVNQLFAEFASDLMDDVQLAKEGKLNGNPTASAA